MIHMPEILPKGKVYSYDNGFKWKKHKGISTIWAKKDPDNKNNVLIDEEVSQNVYNIFMMYKSGMSKKKFAII